MSDNELPEKSLFDELDDKIEEQTETHTDELQEETIEEEQQESIVDLHKTQYSLPSDVESFVDVGKGEVVKREDLTPWDVIKAVASKTGTKIQEPRSGCKKCYGRGYIGIDVITNSPVPCTCIYPPQTEDERAAEENLEQKVFPKYNRKQKRQIGQYVKNSMKQKTNFADQRMKAIYDIKINKAKAKLEQVK